MGTDTQKKIMEHYRSIHRKMKSELFTIAEHHNRSRV